MPSQSHFDAIALLKADHRKVEDLFAEFAAAKGAAKKQALVEKICAELSGHTVIEEELFYPACRGKVEDALLNEGYVGTYEIRRPQSGDPFLKNMAMMGGFLYVAAFGARAWSLDARWLHRGR
jgi:hypothetical protein